MERRENGTYDLVILGGGAAAFAAAIRADELGYSSVIVNHGLPMGGTCVNVGCIPSKFLLETGNEYFYRQSPQFACNLPGAVHCDFPEAISAKDRVVRQLRQENYRAVLKDRKIDYIESTAHLLPGRRVRAGRRLLEGRRILIATGGHPRIPPIPGLASARYMTHRTLMRQDRLPKELVVLGGGPMGLEFAQMYSHFGSRVTLIQSSDRILPREEPELSAELAACLTREGIRLCTSLRVTRVERSRDRIRIDADGACRFEADDLLVATGLSPNTDGIGVSEAGLAQDARGFLRVNRYLETSRPGIYAAGDVTGHRILESVAAKEGAVAATNALRGTRQSLRYDEIPHAVFTNPQVASVGFTEAEYHRRGGSCDCRVISMDRIPKARTVGDTRGVLKMVVDARTRRLVGVHIVSPLGADLIHSAAYALRGRLTVEDIIDTVHVFPTFSESLKYAAQSFHHDMLRPMSCCIE